MRTKKAIVNIFCSLVSKLIIIICGFILPRTILQVYGSEVNGLVSSISRFLGYISMLEIGIGGVTKAALYRPISQNDIVGVSGVVKAAENFYRTLAKLFLVYVLALAVLYPNVISTEFSFGYTFTLVIIISISIFAQYYFGISYTILLDSRQESYISNLLQGICIAINTILSCTLMINGVGIHVVKLCTTIIYLIRPLFIFGYVHLKRLVVKTLPNEQAISQRFNGLGQHLAYFIHQNTDIAVITIFLNLYQVSVYSVYLLIVGGIRDLACTISGGIQAGIGDIIARGEKRILHEVLDEYETLFSIIIVSLFSTTFRLVVPFVLLYTQGINDVEYCRFDVGLLMVLAELVFCIRVPYSIIISAAGHYKETQNAAFIEAGLNIVLSIILVKPLGIAGILCATIISISYRLVYFVKYLQNNILFRNVSVFIKRLSFIILVFGICLLCDCMIPNILIIDYVSFFVDGILVFVVNIAISIGMSIVFYKNSVYRFWHRMRKVFFK